MKNPVPLSPTFFDRSVGWITFGIVDTERVDGSCGTSGVVTLGGDSGAGGGDGGAIPRGWAAA